MRQLPLPSQKRHFSEGGGGSSCLRRCLLGFRFVGPLANCHPRVTPANRDEYSQIENRVNRFH